MNLTGGIDQEDLPILTGVLLPEASNFSPDPNEFKTKHESWQKDLLRPPSPEHIEQPVCVPNELYNIDMQTGAPFIYQEGADQRQLEPQPLAIDAPWDPPAEP